MNDAQLAIMAKIRLLYEGSGEESNIFVTFPELALPMTERDLAFIADDDEDQLSPQERLQAAADFATQVNLVPRVRPLWVHDGTLLWNECERILTQAQVAGTSLSEEETRTLERARALLYQPQEAREGNGGPATGNLVPTPMLEAYQECQQAYFAAHERFTAARLTAEHAEDPVVRGQWEVQKERLQSEVDQARRDWVSRGHKNEVEEAFADIDRLTGRGPKLMWDDWKDVMRRAERNDVNVDRTFYETAYWPPRFYREETKGTWTTLTLHGSEVDSLSAGAVEELSTLATETSEIGADVEIESLSVELARVEIMRPWFDPALLRSRAWRWGHEHEPLSDGGDPPQGSVPAYTTSLIFARNLTITLAPQSSRNEAAVDRLQNGALLSFGNVLLEQVPSTAQPKKVTSLKSAEIDPQETLFFRAANFAPPVEAESGRMMAMARPRFDSATASFDLESVRPALRSLVMPASGPLLGRARAQPAEARPALSTVVGRVLERDAEGTVGDGINQAYVTYEQEDGEGMTTVQSDDSGAFRVRLAPGRYRITARRFGYKPFRNAPDVTVIHADEWSSTNIFLEPEPEEEREVELWKSVQLIAFVCQKVPKAPNPDPGLEWA